MAEASLKAGNTSVNPGRTALAGVSDGMSWAGADDLVLTG
jgi:hypothetical protein